MIRVWSECHKTIVENVAIFYYYTKIYRYLYSSSGLLRDMCADVVINTQYVSKIKDIGKS